MGRRCPHGCGARAKEAAGRFRSGAADRGAAGTAPGLGSHGTDGRDRSRRRVPRGGLARVELLGGRGVLVFIAALVFAGSNAVGYMTTGGYIQNYATNPNGPIGLERGPVLWAVAGSAGTWLPPPPCARAGSGPPRRRRPPHPRG